MSGLSLTGSIIRDEQGCYWLLEFATDLETAQEAITMAKVTGSVGAHVSEGEWGKPVKRNAMVRRLTFLAYTPQGVYNAHEPTVDWHHPVLSYQA